MQPIIIILTLFFIPGQAMATVITSDTVWQGEMEIQEDVLVPDGITLTILPGTRIKISASESTKTDPEYISHQTEITIRGTLKVLGEQHAPVIFFQESQQESEAWAGIIIDEGNADIRFCTIRDAETGLLVLDGSVEISDSRLEQNRYSIIGQGSFTKITISRSQIQENQYGPLTLNHAVIKQHDSILSGNTKRDGYAANADQPLFNAPPTLTPQQKISRIYQDDVLLGTTIWKGRIRIEGRVRLPIDGRLIILPGTLVEFTKKDTNGDGIGENGLMVQGIFIAKGTKEQPILFRSAEKHRKRGDWDSINILGSEETQNLFEFCRIEDAYRGLHSHFSNVAVLNSTLLNNYRAIQFQESLVTIKNTRMYQNKSGIRARDSEVVFTNNHIFENLSGANFFRLNLKAYNNIFSNNARNGIRIREGAVVVDNNLMQNNRFGLEVNDAAYGAFTNNILSQNLETGLALRNTDNLKITGNSIKKNGINGVIIRESSAAISNNHISDNGERGIGIRSFSGALSNNNIVNNGLYAIGMDGEGDVVASHNWWGVCDMAEVIYDAEDDTNLGKVLFEPSLKAPVPFQVPTPPTKSGYQQ